jgi:hypothetical protein
MTSIIHHLFFAALQYSKIEKCTHTYYYLYLKHACLHRNTLVRESDDVLCPYGHYFVVVASSPPQLIPRKAIAITALVYRTYVWILYVRIHPTLAWSFCHSLSTVLLRRRRGDVLGYVLLYTVGT